MPTTKKQTHYKTVAHVTLSAAVAILMLKSLHLCGVDLNSSSAEVQGAVTVVVHYLLRRAGVTEDE